MAFRSSATRVVIQFLKKPKVFGVPCMRRAFFNSKSDPPAEAIPEDAKNGDSQNGKKPNQQETKTPDPAQPNAELKAAQEQIVKLGEEVSKYKDYCLRAIAEQDNIRKRLNLETENERTYSISKFAKEVLDVADNLTRTIESVPKDAQSSLEKSTKALSILVEGVNMTNSSLKNTLQRFGIEEFNPLGQKFDPNFHEALFNLEDSGRANGTVGIVMTSGYKIKDRVLRVAKVGVVRNPAA